MSLKKYLIIILILLIPLKINAQEIEAIIKINNELEGTDTIKESFYYELTDIEGNIIQTKDSKEKEITFDPITFTDADENKTFYYKVNQKETNNKNIKYDEETIYVGIKITKEEGELKEDISYVKLNNYIKQTANPFHINEEDLEKESYAEYDTETKILTFFRDEREKYTDNQVIGNKVYYADIENNISMYEWRNDTTNEVYNREIKKIITKDSIKPKRITYWFRNLEELEEIDISKMDTSEVDDLTGFLSNAKKLRKIDISTMDTSNVRNMSGIFEDSGIEVLDFTLWDMSKVENGRMMQAARNMPNLKYLDISNWGLLDSSAELSNLPCLEIAKLGNIYKFNRTRLGSPDYQFLKIEDNRIYRSVDLEIPSNVEVGDIAGTYIRPSCTKEIAFKNIYKGISNNTNSPEKETEEIINSSTGIDLKLLLVILIVSISIVGIIKTKKNDKG